MAEAPLKAGVSNGSPCPVCLDDELTEPVVCPCAGAHAFCRECVRAFRRLECPVCRDGSEAVSAFVFELSKPESGQAEWMQEQMVAAAQTGAVNIIKILLGWDFPQDTQKPMLLTPLMHAALNGHVAAAGCLLAATPDIEVKNIEGETALMLAVDEGQVAVTRFLIDAKANVQANCDGETPLHIAATGGNVELVQLLMSAGADQDAIFGEDSFIPLHSAALEGHVGAVRCLIANKCDMEATTAESETPLMLAAETGSINMVQFLLEAGANLKARAVHGFTALHVASSNGHIELVQFLIQAKADKNVTTASGWTCAHSAAQSGHADVAKLLLDLGDDGILDDDKVDFRLMHLASGGGHLDVVKLLVSKNASIDTAMWDGQTPLHMAVYHNHIEVVQFLIAARASLESSSGGAAVIEQEGDATLHVGQRIAVSTPIRLGDGKYLYPGDEGVVLEVFGGDSDAVAKVTCAPVRGQEEIVFDAKPGQVASIASEVEQRTALQIAAGAGHVAVVRELLDVGASLNQGPLTALQCAAEEGHLHVVNLLLVKKSNVLSQANDATGWNAVQCAAAYGHAMIMNTLICAEPAVLLVRGPTRLPLHLAAESGHREVVESLFAWGSDGNALGPLSTKAVASVSSPSGWEAPYGTALHLAAMHNHLHILASLIRLGVDLEAGRPSALILAARKGMYGACNILIEARAQLQGNDEVGQASVLQVAAEQGHEQIVRYLLRDVIPARCGTSEFDSGENRSRKRTGCDTPDCNQACSACSTIIRDSCDSEDNRSLVRTSCDIHKNLLSCSTITPDKGGPALGRNRELLVSMIADETAFAQHLASNLGHEVDSLEREFKTGRFCAASNESIQQLADRIASLSRFSKRINDFCRQLPVETARANQSADSGHFAADDGSLSPSKDNGSPNFKAWLSQQRGASDAPLKDPEDRDEKCHETTDSHGDPDLSLACCCRGSSSANLGVRPRTNSIDCNWRSSCVVPASAKEAACRILSDATEQIRGLQDAAAAWADRPVAERRTVTERPLVDSSLNDQSLKDKSLNDAPLNDQSQLNSLVGSLTFAHMVFHWLRLAIETAQPEDTVNVTRSTIDKARQRCFEFTGATENPPQWPKQNVSAIMERTFACVLSTLEGSWKSSSSLPPRMLGQNSQTKPLRSLIENAVPDCPEGHISNLVSIFARDGIRQVGDLVHWGFTALSRCLQRHPDLKWGELMDILTVLAEAKIESAAEAGSSAQQPSPQIRQNTCPTSQAPGNFGNISTLFPSLTSALTRSSGRTSAVSPSSCQLSVLESGSGRAVVTATEDWTHEVEQALRVATSSGHARVMSILTAFNTNSSPSTSTQAPVNFEHDGDPSVHANEERPQKRHCGSCDLPSMSPSRTTSARRLLADEVRPTTVPPPEPALRPATCMLPMDVDLEFLD